jgi:hypothetical protein
MKQSISRAKLCRQKNLTEIQIDIDGSLTPSVSGLDARFVESIDYVSAGRYTVNFKDVGQSDIVPVSIMPALGTFIGRSVAVTPSSITIEMIEIATGLPDEADCKLVCLFHEASRYY